MLAIRHNAYGMVACRWRQYFSAEDERSITILEAAATLEEKYHLTSDQILLLLLLTHPSKISQVLDTAPGKN
jgi:hypothetical protein